MGHAQKINKQNKYDAKGQRTKVEYGNGTKTTYTYDSKTFRLTRLYTTDGNNVTLQDLNYWYDTVGNINWKKDNCVPTQYYKNTMVTGDNKYTYDALYRLLTATGRENDAAVNFTSADNTDDSPFILKHGANDAMNMQNYTQNYNYDAVGNILQLQHSAAQGSYTRNYTYNSSNNRLLTTQIGSNTPYSYNHHAQHGYLTSLPHLSVLNWNFKEEVVATSKQTVNSGTPETTYYQYDSKGKRLRKVTENASTSSTFTKKDSRVYIEGYEFYENFSGTAYVTHSLSLIDTSASLSAGGGQRFVMIESTTNPALAGYLVRYQHPNHQSSSTLETDDVGAVISYEEYHPFGTTSYQAMEKPVRAAAKRYRYTGMERDDETGLSYHSARYYISWLGRWLNPDPIGIGDGVNVYGYCKGNPVKNVDKKGTQTTLPNNQPLTLNVNVALNFGTHNNSFHISGSLTKQFGKVELATGIGVNLYGTYANTKKSGGEFRFSFKGGYNDGRTAVNIGTNVFVGTGKLSEFNQRTGILNIGVGKFNFSYENDGMPFALGQKGLKAWAGDGDDKYRTAAVRISYDKYSLGFNLFTGRRDNYKGDQQKVGNPIPTRYGVMPNGFVNETGKRYRMGALYFGYKDSKIGIDSDKYVRHPIQDLFAHNMPGTRQPGFVILSDKINPYVQINSSSLFNVFYQKMPTFTLYEH